MTLETLDRTTWSEIKVGEVFAWEWCWMILVKEPKGARVLSCDGKAWLWMDYDYRWSEFMFIDKNEMLYKLSKEVQALWKEE